MTCSVPPRSQWLHWQEAIGLGPLGQLADQLLIRRGQAGERLGPGFYSHAAFGLAGALIAGALVTGLGLVRWWQTAAAIASLRRATRVATPVIITGSCGSPHTWDARPAGPRRVN